MEKSRYTVVKNFSFTVLLPVQSQRFPWQTSKNNGAAPMNLPEISPRSVPLIESERLCLTLLPPSSALRVVAYYHNNRAHLAPWDPVRPLAFYTEAFWTRALTQAHTEFQEGRAIRLQIVARDHFEGEVLGICNFSQLFRGTFCACYLGYSLDHRYEGKGYMREALHAAIDYMFRVEQIHRIMANYIPTNERSGRLLRRLGFVVEGYARDYLFLNGAWRDHVLTSLTNPTLDAPAPRPPAPRSPEVLS